MYKIIGGDGKEYGPVSAEQLRQWLGEGRVNAQTQVQPAGATDWKPLGSCPELTGQIPPPLVSMSAPAKSVKNSGLAITSLVLGCLGIVTCGATSIFGLILGLVGLNKINRSNGQLGGKSLAVAGISVSGATLLLIPLMAALLLPAIATARGRAHRVSCMSNLKQVGLGLLQYADDHTNQLPLAATWADAIQEPYLGDSSKIFECPRAKGQISYVFNVNLSGATLEADPELVLVIEAPLGWNASVASPDSLPPSSHKDGRNVLFTDGHVEWVTNSRLSSLRWKPQPKTQ